MFSAMTHAECHAVALHALREHGWAQQPLAMHNIDVLVTASVGALDTAWASPWHSCQRPAYAHKSELQQASRPSHFEIRHEIS